MHKQCMARFSYVSGKGLSCQCQNFAQILQFHTFQLPLRLEPMRLMSPASFSPARLPFFCDCLGSASCDTVEPGSCSNRRKNSCPRSVTSKDPIFLLGNSILLASRAALLFSPPPAPDQTCQKGIALRAHPFSPIVRGTCFFAGPRTLPLGCFQTFCRDTSRVPCGPFPALQQAPDRRTCHGQKMEEILDRARTCALFL